MKYATAMISRQGSPLIRIDDNLKSVARAVVALTEKPSDEPTGVNHKAIISGELREIEDAVDDHECSPINLDEMGGESINGQMERAGFLNGEVVVILRESDFAKIKLLAAAAQVGTQDPVIIATAKEFA